MERPDDHNDLPDVFAWSVAPRSRSVARTIVRREAVRRALTETTRTADEALLKIPSGRPIFEKMLTGASRANTEGGFIVSESFAFHVSEKQGCVRLEVARHTSTDPDGTPVVQSLMRPEEARKLARFLNAYAYDVDHAMPALDASAMMRFDRDS